MPYHGCSNVIVGRPLTCIGLRFYWFNAAVGFLFHKETISRPAKTKTVIEAIAIRYDELLVPSSPIIPPQVSAPTKDAKRSSNAYKDKPNHISSLPSIVAM